MMKIKNILYLDEPKMYSLASQLLGGVTELQINRQTQSKMTGESQEGRIFEGKNLKGELSNVQCIEEHRHLHDFFFTEFEEALAEKSMLQEDVTPENIRNNSLVKISGISRFNDTRQICQWLQDFNKVGEALAYFLNHSNDTNQSIIQPKRNRSAIKNQKIYAAKNELRQDEKLLKSLNTIIQAGYQGQFEVQTEFKDFTFLSSLIRSHLREPEDVFIKKYSRQTEVDICVVGIITQCQPLKDSLPREVEEENMKEVIYSFVEAIWQLENSYSGRTGREIIIDPIALYTEIT